jgi:phosphate transport system substrate-binding protein
MRRLLVLAAAVALCAGPLIGAGAAGASVTANTAVTAQIEGSGSTWAQNAIDQWITDVTARGLQVIYTGSGSAQGRIDFRNDVTDFAVSDIGFQGFDPSTDTNDTNCQNTNPLSDCRPYVYLPIVAGGTSFPYQIRVAGQLVESLRLSGETIAKIFTGGITNWDDPEIASDNNHKFYLANNTYVTSLPNLQIHPVADSQGSGASAQFSLYLDTEYPSIWKPFSDGVGMTEYFPQKDGITAEPGSQGIIDYVTSAAANGAIGYDEYSYAKNINWPVADLENSAGYFVAPTQYNVAVALTLAQINMDKSSANYLLQNLDNVYTNSDKRTYPLSSYSYMIMPTSPSDPRLGDNAAPEAQTLADFIDWSICGGQREVGPAGYSPLPINLAQASFEQMYKLHTADSAVSIANLNVATQCNNPTFWAGHPDGNYLAQIAPEPYPCAQSGQGPCSPSEAVGSTGNPQGGKAPPPSGGTSPSPGSSTSSGATSPGSSTSPSSGTAADTGGGGTSGTTTGDSGGGQEADVGMSTALAESEGNGYGGWLVVLVAVEVLLLLVIPPLVVLRRQRRIGR